MAVEGNKDQFDEGQWEERSLNVLKGSKIDQEFLAVKLRKRGVTKREMKWDWTKTKPMLVLPEVIIELQDKELRENAILYISKYLIDKREDDPNNYYRAGFLLFNSCCTVAVLLQEVIGFYRKTDDTLNARSIMHLANVLTLFQSVAANNETRQQFVDACIPNYLIPLIQFKSAIAMFDNIRAIALSVIGILCQGGEPKIIQWAIESDVVSVCHTIMDTGSELNKVIAIHILEAIFQDSLGLSYICSPICSQLLEGLMKSWNKLVHLLAVDQDFSPRLLFHIIRCYIILCTHARGYDMVARNLPDALTDDSFRGMKEESPIIRQLLQMLLFNLGEVPKEPSFRKPDYVYPAEKANMFGHCPSPTVSSYGRPQGTGNLDRANFSVSPLRASSCIIQVDHMSMQSQQNRILTLLCIGKVCLADLRSCRLTFHPRWIIHSGRYIFDDISTSRPTKEIRHVLELLQFN